MFRRHSASGLLTYSPEASYNTDWTQAKANGEWVANPRSEGIGDGFPLRGLAAFRLSTGGGELFCVSVLDSCVAVFARNDTSGALKITKIIRDGDQLGSRVVDGLAGARSVAVSTSGRLYVAGWRDQAIAAFEKVSATDFAFLGRLKEGERIMSSFNDTTWDLRLDHPQDPEYEKSWSTGTFPMRLGGNGYASSFSAHDSRYFEIMNPHSKSSMPYLAVAASNVDSSKHGPGAVFVYAVPFTPGSPLSPRLVQTLSMEVGSVSIATSKIVDPVTLEVSYYLISGNGFSLHAAATSSPLHVYKFNHTSARFKFHHAPIPTRAKASYVSRVATLSVGGLAQPGNAQKQQEHLAAVAHFWDGETTQVDSVVLRFSLSDQRFTVLALLPGFGAVDVALVPLSSSSVSDTLILLANSLPGTCGNLTMATGFVAVYRLATPAGDGGGYDAVTLLQCLEAQGVMDLESFSIDGEWMLAVSQRQAEDDGTTNTPSYRQNSSIYRYSAKKGKYEHNQTLDAAFGSVPDSTASEAEKQRFCRAGGVPGAHADECLDLNASHVVPGLRGATSMQYFDNQGEGYLAVAQSVCPRLPSRFAGNEFCEQLGMVQPRSAILQYDRRQGRFDACTRAHSHSLAP